MGIHKALTKLVSEVPSVDEEAQQILVSSARVWCALFAFGKSLTSTHLIFSLFIATLFPQNISKFLMFATSESW